MLTHIHATLSRNKQKGFKLSKRENKNPFSPSFKHKQSQSPIKSVYYQLTYLINGQKT